MQTSTQTSSPAAPATPAPARARQGLEGRAMSTPPTEVGELPRQPAEPARRMSALRRRPRLWDYCYFTARTNLEVLERVTGRASAATCVVDIGCGTKPFRALFHPDCTYTGLDFDDRSAADLVHDLGRALPLADGCADVVLLSEVLEHVPDPELVLREAARLLVAGGELYLSAPFAFPIHGRPHDYRRFTDYYFRDLPGRLPLELVELEVSNQVFTTPLLLVNQLVLSAPLPWSLKRVAWSTINTLALGLELCARPWRRRDSRLGLFLRMNPSGYALRFRRRAS